MSKLSEYLDYLLNEKNISKYVLAKKIGIDNSSFYKMLSGQRKIKAEILDGILASVPFSYMEEQKLRQLHRILTIGEEKYQRRQEILKFINALNDDREDFSFHYKTDFSICASSAVHGKKNLYKVISSIIFAENSSKESLKIICQTDFSFLYDTLKLISERKNLKIEQIICFENRSKKQEAENIHSLTVIAPLFRSSFSYNIYYFYDNIDSCCGDMILFPFMVLGSSMGVIFSADYEEGIVFVKPESCMLLSQRFEKIRSRSTALLAPCQTINDTRQKLKKYAGIKEPYVLCPNIFFSNSCDVSFLISLIKEEIPERDELIFLLKNEGKKIKESARTNRVHSYFTREGITDFWESGHLIDVLADYYNPVPKPGRKTLLLKTLEAIHEDKLEAQLLRENRLQLSRDFYLIMQNESMISCLLKKKDGSFSNLIFHENLLCEGMADFFKSLEEENMLETKEETVNFIKNLINS